LDFETIFSVNVATQCIFYSHALQVVGWFDERVQCGLLVHRNCDGGRNSKDEFCHNLHGNQAGRVLVQLISQRPIQRLDTVQLYLGQSRDGAYFKRRNSIVHIRFQPTMIAKIEVVLKALHGDAMSAVSQLWYRGVWLHRRAPTRRRHAWELRCVRRPVVPIGKTLIRGTSFWLPCSQHLQGLRK
jgi:hypothetical protein